MESEHDKEKIVCSLSEGPYKWVYATSTTVERNERNERNHRTQSDPCSYNFCHVVFARDCGGSLASRQTDETGKGLDLVSLSHWVPLLKTPFAVPNVPCPNIQFDWGSKEFTNPFYPAKPCSPIRSSCIFRG